LPLFLMLDLDMMESVHSLIKGKQWAMSPLRGKVVLITAALPAYSHTGFIPMI
jgi:hypothetical protein